MAWWRRSVDFVLLRDEEALVSALPPDLREETHAATRRAVEALTSASILRRAGRTVDAAAMTAAATHDLLAAADRAGLAVDGVDREALAVAEAALPRLDGPLSATHESAERRVRAAADELVRVLRPYSRTATERRSARILNVLSLVAFVAMAGLGVRQWLRPRVSVVASGQWGSKHPPEAAIDDDSSTEWLLPDNQGGWIDLHLSRPKRVRAVRILNGTNKATPPRAVMDYRLEFFARGVHVRTIEGSFGAFDPLPSYLTIPTSVGTPVERVRFVVVSWSGTGGAVAEIRLE